MRFHGSLTGHALYLWNELSGEKLTTGTDLSKTSSKDGLYPLQALIRPIALRFKYHFEGTRQTNRLDKVCHLSSIDVGMALSYR